MQQFCLKLTFIDKTPCKSWQIIVISHVSYLHGSISFSIKKHLKAAVSPHASGQFIMLGFFFFLNWRVEYIVTKRDGF